MLRCEKCRKDVLERDTGGLCRDCANPEISIGVDFDKSGVPEVVLFETKVSHQGERTQFIIPKPIRGSFEDDSVYKLQATKKKEGEKNGTFRGPHYGKG